MPKFINTELKSDSESDLHSDLQKIEAKIDNKLESESQVLILNKTFYFFKDIIFQPSFVRVKNTRAF